jgi:hypothetical protein
VVASSSDATLFDRHHARHKLAMFGNHFADLVDQRVLESFQRGFARLHDLFRFRL